MYDSIKRRRGEISETQEDTEEDEEEQDGTNIWYFTKKNRAIFPIRPGAYKCFPWEHASPDFFGKKVIQQTPHRVYENDLRNAINIKCNQFQLLFEFVLH